VLDRGCIATTGNDSVAVSRRPLPQRASCERLGWQKRPRFEEER
jgi:hypothetical protein